MFSLYAEILSLFKPPSSSPNKSFFLVAGSLDLKLLLDIDAAITGASTTSSNRPPALHKSDLGLSSPPKLTLGLPVSRRERGRR